MNKSKKLISHLRQKELKWLKYKKCDMDGCHYPKDYEMYKRMTEWSCFNCESMHLEKGIMMCGEGDDYRPCRFACHNYSFCGKDRLRSPMKIVDYEG